MFKQNCCKIFIKDVVQYSSKIFAVIKAQQKIAVIKAQLEIFRFRENGDFKFGKTVVQSPLSKLLATYRQVSNSKDGYILHRLKKRRQKRSEITPKVFDLSRTKPRLILLCEYIL